VSVTYIPLPVITLAERVETYQALRLCDAEYQSHRSLAKATGLSDQKITQDFQAYQVLVKLAPHGITVASDLPASSDERQQGKVLPEYHAVLLYQAMSSLAGDEAGDAAEEHLLALARKLAAMSQAAAKAYVEAVKRRREVERHQRDDTSSGTDGGVVTCAYCEHQLALTHVNGGTHQVKPYSPH
jgi:hypothetical protein